METETIISLVVGLVGALGLKEGWNIWKKKIDNSTQIKSEIREDNRQRIKELEDQVKITLLKLNLKYGKIIDNGLKS